MKHKLLLITAIGAVVALAYAQSVTISSAFGTGLAGAPGAERPNAQFRFSVKQAEYNGQTRQAGSFTIEVRESNRLVAIQMHELRQLAVNLEDKVATFSGTATAAVRTRQGVERARGVVVVRVADRRNPSEAEGDPDTITVAFFTNPDSEEPTYTYRGVVRRGDIVVFEETRSR